MHLRGPRRENKGGQNYLRKMVFQSDDAFRSHLDKKFENGLIRLKNLEELLLHFLLNEQDKDSKERNKRVFSFLIKMKVIYLSPFQQLITLNSNF